MWAAAAKKIQWKTFEMFTGFNVINETGSNLFIPLICFFGKNKRNTRIICHSRETQIPYAFNWSIARLMSERNVNNNDNDDYTSTFKISSTISLSPDTQTLTDDDALYCFQKPELIHLLWLFHFYYSMIMLSFSLSLTRSLSRKILNFENNNNN